jgi:hypothetical protein
MQMQCDVTVMIRLQGLGEILRRLLTWMLLRLIVRENCLTIMFLGT